MAKIIIFILGMLVIVSAALFIYFIQKKDEENQELKNIIQNVHGKVENFKHAPAYNNISGEVKEIVDYVDLNTSSTTVLNPSPNLLKDIWEKFFKIC